MRRLISTSFIWLGIGCGPAVEPQGGSTSATEDTSDEATTEPSTTEGATSQAPTSGPTTEPVGESTVDPGTSSSSGSSTGTTGSAGICPGNPASDCTVMPDCGPNTPCGHPANYLDEFGCPRPWCTVNRPCDTGTRCYFPVECAGICTDTMVTCGDTLFDGRTECSCGGEAICVGIGHCIPEDEWPGCCLLDSDTPEKCPPPEVPRWE